MLQTSVKDEIISRLDGLTLDQLQKVLKLVQSMTADLPPAQPVENLLEYVGSITPEDLQAMAAAIEEECERIGPSM
jgi:predicted Zn-dependent peptidase